MDVLATAAGVVTAVAIKVGDKVSEGALIVTVAAAGAAPAPAAARRPAPAAAPCCCRACRWRPPLPRPWWLPGSLPAINEAKSFATAHAGRRCAVWRASWA